MPVATIAPDRAGGGRAGAGAVALATVGLAAASIGGVAPLCFAAAAIGTIGLAHGASDVAVIARADRVPFLVLYLLVGAATLLLWRWCPALALSGFLALSIVHFAIESPEAAQLADRAALGAIAVAGPALLHVAALTALFEALTGDPAVARGLAVALAVTAALALLPLARLLARQRADTATLALGIGAAVLLPPLAGFPIAFILLHAWPQLEARMAATGSGSVGQYLVRHGGILAGATLVIAIAAWTVAGRVSPAVSTLFAALAALAVPHMIVTARFEEAPPPRRAH